MKKLPLKARRLMQKHMRIIRHVGVKDAQGWFVPVFADRLLNTACWRYANNILEQRTHRRKIQPAARDWD